MWPKRWFILLMRILIVMAKALVWKDDPAGHLLDEISDIEHSID